MELLLGRSAAAHDAAISKFVSGREPDERAAFPAIASRPACEYHNYKSLGLSLCFEDSLLQGIHIYNGTHGYAAYKGELPHSLRLQMTGREVVELLGEPDVKTGGGRGGAVSIAYSDRGLHINFVGRDWEDRDNVIDSITMYKPAAPGATVLLQEL